MSRKVYAHSKGASDAPKPFRAAKEVRTAAAAVKPKRTIRTKAVRGPKAPKSPRRTTVEPTRASDLVGGPSRSDWARATPAPKKGTGPQRLRLPLRPKRTGPKGKADGVKPEDRRTAGKAEESRARAARARASQAAPRPTEEARPTGETRPKQPTGAANRRHRLPVTVAVAFALVLLATSFPLTSLLSQRHQMAADSAALSELHHQNKLLGEQESALNSKTEIDRLARQDYQLVSPGQTLYQVLPASGSSATTLPGGIQAGDPGTRSPVSPSQAPDMAPDPGLPKAPVGATVSASGGTSGSDGSLSHNGNPPSTFWGRVANTLEFWS